MKANDFFKVKVYEKTPSDFLFQVEVAACYLEINNKLLLLQRGFEKSESGKWGVPAGKLEPGESPEEGAVRELFEETGISITSGSQIKLLQVFYIRKPEIDYAYHLFQILFDQQPEVRISNEHQDYKWATTKDLNELPLMDGAKEILEKYERNKKQDYKRSE